jgi:N6-adenosine-specific RNA methylase IME4
VEKFFEGLTGKFGTILIDPPWRFKNRTGKIAPEHKRLARYETLGMAEIAALPVGDFAREKSHLYLWCPNALLPDAIGIMRNWGFAYKTNLVWVKVTSKGAVDRRGVGFYYRNVTELLLFGVRGHLRTKAAARSQENLFASRKEEHSRKPTFVREIIERCSPAPYRELFARDRLESPWTSWGNQHETYDDSRNVHRNYRGDGGTQHFIGT